MSKPTPAPAKHEWRKWPQFLAPNESIGLPRRIRRVHGINARLLYAAERLSERTGAPIHEIVVFYPRCMNGRVESAFRRVRRLGKSEEYRGLTVASTPRLRGLGIAFRIEDVENHRTPADSYYVLVRSNGKPGERELAPKALYDADESGTGGRIEE